MTMKFNSVDAQAVAPVAQVTVLTTATGTLVIAGSVGTGPGAGTQGQVNGAFYGANVISAAGSATSTTTLNVYSVNGTNTVQLMPTVVATGGGFTGPGPSGVGIAYTGALVAVLSGGPVTGNQINLLWD